MRVSIRTLLVVIALLAIVFSIVAVTTRDYRKRLRIESDLRSMGAHYVAFNENNDSDWVAFVVPIASSRIAAYKTIENLDLSGAHVTDASIRHIAGLKRIEMLDLTDSDITDEQLELLSGIDSVKILRLNRSNISDSGIPAIASINDLMAVDLSGTLVTDDGVMELKQRRPDIVVRREPPNGRRTRELHGSNRRHDSAGRGLKPVAP